jgi:hypothetical protein
MRTGSLIVGKIIVQRSTQRSLIPHDHVVQALASNGAHEPFRKGILPGGSRRRKHFLRKVRSHPWIAKDVRVRGFIFGVETDLLREVHPIAQQTAI